MKTSTFFRVCKELVEFRWTVRLRSDGSIRLSQILEESREEPSSVLPIVAVARDVYGLAVTDINNPWEAGKLLELPEEFTGLIVTASRVSAPNGDRIISVREELVDAVVVSSKFRLFAYNHSV